MAKAKSSSTGTGGKKLSPYNKFMKSELPKVKVDKPTLSHKEAFKEVATRWKTSPLNPNSEKKTECALHERDQRRQDRATTELVPWKYCNPYADNRCPERLFLFQGKSVFIHQRLGEQVTIDQNTGNVVWDGAYLMSKYLEAHVSLQGKTCLELGAGTGLVSIVAWLLGARTVLATDLPGAHTEHVLKNTSANASRIEIEQEQTIQKAQAMNALEHRRNKASLMRLRKEDIQVNSLDWSDPVLPDSLAFQGPFSFIFCSEILYLPKLHRALLKTLNQFSDKDTVVIFLWKERGLGENRFFNIACCPSTGWSVNYLQKDVLDPEFQEQPYRIALLTRCPTAHQ